MKRENFEHDNGSVVDIYERVSTGGVSVDMEPRREGDQAKDSARHPPARKQ